MSQPFLLEAGTNGLLPESASSDLAKVESSSQGLRFRKARSGPEQELVTEFMAALSLQVPAGHRVTVFREPKLETGFPDLVLVVWSERITQGWPSQRLALKLDDLKVMHFLFHVRHTTEITIQSYFGKPGVSSLSRLVDAGMVRRTGRAWQPRSLSACFAASKIVAVEAKVRKWASVLSQARQNTWFASKSYVLTPASPSKSQQREAASYGIGVFSLGGSELVEIEAGVARLPRSYASWILNDYAWRCSQATGVEQR